MLPGPSEDSELPTHCRSPQLQAANNASSTPEMVSVSPRLGLPPTAYLPPMPNRQLQVNFAPSPLIIPPASGDLNGPPNSPTSRDCVATPSDGLGEKRTELEGLWDKLRMLDIFLKQNIDTKSVLPHLLAYISMSVSYSQSSFARLYRKKLTELSMNMLY